MRHSFLMSANGIREHEVSGNPVKFSTNVTSPLQQYQIAFIPRQGGSGDPTPSNVRVIPALYDNTLGLWHSGKNMIGASDIQENYVIDANGDIKSDNTGCMTKLIPVSAGSYGISLFNNTTSSWNVRIHAYSPRKNWMKQIKTTLVAAKSYYFYNLSLDYDDFIKYIRISMPKNHTSLQMEANATTRTGYEEFVQRTDRSIFLPATGKNLISDSRMDYFIPSETGTYTFSATIDNTNGSSAAKVIVTVFDKNDSEVNFSGSTVSAGQTGRSYTAFNFTSNDSYVTFEVFGTNATGSEFQLEKGSLTAYEEAKPIYGGIFDSVQGGIWQTWAGYNVSDISGWKKSSGIPVFYADMEFPRGSNTSNIICNKYKTLSDTTSISDMPDYSVKGNSEDMDRIYFKDSTYSSADDFAANSNAFFVYELATPRFFPVTDFKNITTLKGVNTIWSDTNSNADYYNVIKYLKKG